MGQTWSQEINEEHQNTSNNGLNKITRMMGRPGGSEASSIGLCKASCIWSSSWSRKVERAMACREESSHIQPEVKRLKTHEGLITYSTTMPAV
jgi:hypothetical protein